MSESMSAAQRPALRAGMMIGQYEVIAFVGAGGMGEVYRARDLRIDRDVAIKILPHGYGSDDERVRRFRHEARATAQLSHPNVVAMHDIGEHEGRPYIVTEFLEGETLRTFIEHNGPLSVRRAIGFAAQIARALAAAHRKNIVHRDLKPANIFITRDGHVKVLDFGLAKLVRPAWEERVEADSSTISALSVPGSVIGTSGYMSPEQIEARAIDHRSDIFSFGVIVYEMLTATRAFKGPTVPATLSSILKDQPADVTTFRNDVPAALDVIILRCLQKNPAERFQSAEDLAFSLDEAATQSSSNVSSAAYASLRNVIRRVGKRPAWSFGAIASALVLILLAPAGTRSDSEIAAAAFPRTEATQMERLTSTGRQLRVVAISPRGEYVAHATKSDGESTLWLTHVPTKSATRLATADHFGAAAFSTDGNYVFFTAREGDQPTQLARSPLLGGLATVIGRDVVDETISVSPTGERVLVLRAEDSANTDSRSIFAIDVATGREHRILRPAPNMFLETCGWNADGRKILCSAIRERREVMIEIDVTTRAQRLTDLMPLHQYRFTTDGTNAVGTSAFIHGAQIWSVDSSSGARTKITDDLSYYGPVDASSDGRLVAAVRLDSRINLWKVEVASGELEQLTSGTNTQDGNFGVTVAPDGDVIYASKGVTKTLDLWRLTAGSEPYRLTSDDAADEKWPDFSRDGRYIVFIRQPLHADPPRSDVWRVDADGRNPVQLTTTGNAHNPHLTADGREVFYAEGTEDPDVYVVSIEGGAPRRFAKGRGPVPSPTDAKVLIGNESTLELRKTTNGQLEKTFPGLAAIKRWRPDGKAFAFIQGAKGAPNVFLKTLDDAPPQQITALKTGDGIALGFDWTSDGRSIVFARRTDTRDVVLIKRSPQPSEVFLKSR